MSDLDPKIFNFTFGDLIKNIFTTKKSSYEKINKNNKDNKVNYGSIS
jgi:hypothetical protein